MINKFDKKFDLYENTNPDDKNPANPLVVKAVKYLEDHPAPTGE